jgi:transcriptional regulator with XRE-family HTH domain
MLMGYRMTNDEAANALKKFGAEEIRKSLRKFRRKLKLTQGELASLAGVGQEAISRFEQGKRNLSADALARVQTAIVEALANKKLVVVQAERDLESAKITMERYARSVDQAREEHPDFDEVVGRINHGDLVPPRDPVALKEWIDKKAHEQAQWIKEKWGSSEVFDRYMRFVKESSERLVLQERQTAALAEQLAVLQEQNKALREWLNAEEIAALKHAKAAELREKVHSQAAESKDETQSDE